MMTETGHVCHGNLSHQDKLARVRGFIERNKIIQGALIPVLHDVQDLFGYLPEDALKTVSEELDIPMVEIYGVATFYSFFSLEPKGEHVIRVCLGTACYVNGAQQIIDQCRETLGVEVGKTTADGRFSLEAVRCVGACALAPVLMVGDDVHAKVARDDVRQIVAEYNDAVESDLMFGGGGEKS